MGIFSKRLKKSQTDRAEENRLLFETLGKFPYLETLDGVMTFSKRKVTCDCCAKKVNLYSEMGIYSAEYEPEILCPDCIANGTAAEKFDGTFQCYLDEESVSPEDYDAVMRRTPTILSYQDLEWKVCCGKPCVYMRRAKNVDFPAILEKLKETYSEEEEGVPFEKLSELGGESDDESSLILFRCQTCGRLYGVIDLD